MGSTSRVNVGGAAESAALIVPLDVTIAVALRSRRAQQVRIEAAPRIESPHHRTPAVYRADPSTSTVPRVLVNPGHVFILRSIQAVGSLSRCALTLIER